MSKVPVTVRGHEMLQAGGIKPGQHLTGLRVAQVPEGATDTLFQGLRVRPAHEHIRIVIAFQQQGVAGIQAFDNVGRHTARVRQHSKAAVTVIEAELAGFTCIMRHREGMYLQITNSDR